MMMVRLQAFLKIQIITYIYMSYTNLDICNIKISYPFLYQLLLVMGHAMTHPRAGQ